MNLPISDQNAQHTCGCGCGDHAPAPEQKSCDCGPDCTCGCQDGKPCSCGDDAEKACTCGPDCTCGCQEGKPCTCGEKKCACGPDCMCGCQDGKPCTCGEKVSEAPAAGGAVVATYTVSGMTCGHCTKAVKEEVEAIPGINGADVDLDSGKLTVTSDAPVDFDRIVEACLEAGDYTVE